MSGVYLRSMSRVVDVKTIFLGIKVNLILPVPDRVNVVLNIIKAVFKERAEEAGPLLGRSISLLISGGEYRAPRVWPG